MVRVWGVLYGREALCNVGSTIQTTEVGKKILGNKGIENGES